MTNEDILLNSIANKINKEDIDWEEMRLARQEQEAEREYDDDCDDEEDTHPQMYGDQER